MKILIADDESLIRMDLKDFLESEGHTVVGEAKDGVEALALTKELEPHVILMDINMPRLNGIEAARQIRRLHICPVVLLTAYGQDDLVERAKDSGVYGYLLKPYRENQLVPTLKMAMARFQEEKVLRADISELEQMLAARKLIEKAKGVLTRRQNLSEEEAYQFLRKESMVRRIPMRDFATMIIKGQKEQ